MAGLGTAWTLPRAVNFALALALDRVAIAVLRQRQRHLLSGTPLTLSAAKLMSFNTLQLVALKDYIASIDADMFFQELYEFR